VPDEAHRALLHALYEAERLWSDSGHEPQSFQLIHLGGMQRELSHPGLEVVSPIPTHHAIDDLEELGWIRISHRERNNRTFALTAAGRERASMLADPAESPSSGLAATDPTGVPLTIDIDRAKAMVVFGRNMAARNAMFSFLRSLHLAPIEWEQAVAATGEASPHNSVAVRRAMQSAQAIVVILTAEERAGLLPVLAGSDDHNEIRLGGQPRQNVLLEAGMAHALAAERTILVEIGAIRGASDFAGMNTVRLSNSPQVRAALRQRLITAGCAVDQTATDYLHPDASGDFDRAVVSCVSTDDDILAAAGISRSPRAP
jgi:predicted nucleotide-binding protein